MKEDSILATQDPFFHDDVFTFDHLKFKLDCFVLSFGPEIPHMGRYHPSSDPERYAARATHETTTNRLISLADGEFVERNSAFAINPFSPELPEDIPFPDDFILRELSEMRVLLERLLEARDGTTDYELLNLLVLLPDNQSTSREAIPHFAVGESGLIECGVCLELRWLHRRLCCNYPVCNGCLEQYFGNKVSEGIVQIECCNHQCQSYVHRDEIAARLPAEKKNLFYKILVVANAVANAKTCPRCSYIERVDPKEVKNGVDNQRISCRKCSLEWCFNCHAPWHYSMTCRQFRKGDRMLKTWAKEVSFGQVNAQRCPKCKIYIQRTTGCDHMHCTGCKTDFCYKCGDKFRRLKFLGDHYSKLSIFGCKYRFKADSPVQRKLVRGAILGGKVVVAPALGVLALCAGVMAVGLGVFALPLYGCVRLLRCYKAKQHNARRALPTLLHYNAITCP